MHYIHKLERVLYFVSTFGNRKLEMNKLVCGTLERKVTEHLKVSYPYYDDKGIAILFYDNEKGNGLIHVEHVVKTYPRPKPNDITRLCDSYYQDDYYKHFLMVNTDCDTVGYKLETQHHEILEIPELDLMQEDAEFQYSLLHDDEKLGIMQVVQYFKRKGSVSFCDWMHTDFDKIYEELDDAFNIGREDYLSGNGI